MLINGTITPNDDVLYLIGRKNITSPQDILLIDLHQADLVQIVEMAMKHGALGVSSSYVDVDENFDPVPSRFSCIKEKMALAKAATITGRGVWQVVPYFIDMETQLKNIQDKLSRLIGEKVVINQNAKTKKGFIKINFSKKTVSRVLDKLKSIKPD